MSRIFDAFCLILRFAIPSAMVLSTCTGIGSWGHFISLRVVLMRTASCASMNMGPNSVSLVIRGDDLDSFANNVDESVEEEIIVCKVCARWWRVSQISVLRRLDCTLVVLRAKRRCCIRVVSCY